MKNKYENGEREKEGTNCKIKLKMEKERKRVRETNGGKNAKRDYIILLPAGLRR